jgi:hypothetical protein
VTSQCGGSVEEQEPNPIKSPVAGRQVGVTSRPYHGSRFYEAKTGHSLSLHVRRRPGRSQSLRSCLGISGMKGKEGHRGGEISIISQNFSKSPSILFHPLESSISQTSPHGND